MQKVWTVCVSLLIGIVFAAVYPANRVEAPNVSPPDTQAVFSASLSDPLDQLASSFPASFDSPPSNPGSTSEPEITSPLDSTAEEEISVVSSPTPAETASSEPADPDETALTHEFYIPEIPLSQELQQYTYQQCQEKQVSYELVLAMMYHESNYDPSAVRYYQDGSSDSGIMQINSINSQSLYELYGITNLQDPYENIQAGVSIISGFVHQYGEHDGLMAYNMGPGGYQNAIANGIYTTTYAQNIMETKSEIENLRQSL